MTRALAITLGLALVALLAILLLLNQCSETRKAADQATLSTGQASAAIEAGAAAGNVVTTITTNDAATDTAVKGGLDEIRSAPAASRNLAAQCAACRLRGSRGADQRCAALREARSCESAPTR